MDAGAVDLLIKSGKVVDGTGNPWFYGDVLVGGDRILDVLPAGRASEGVARPRLDALPRLAGGNDRGWRLAEHRLLPGRQHTA